MNTLEIKLNGLTLLYRVNLSIKDLFKCLELAKERIENEIPIKNSTYLINSTQDENRS